jgi:hypothetical protein
MLKKLFNIIFVACVALFAFALVYANDTEIAVTGECIESTATFTITGTDTIDWRLVQGRNDICEVESDVFGQIDFGIRGVAVRSFSTGFYAPQYKFCVWDGEVWQFAFVPETCAMPVASEIVEEPGLGPHIFIPYLMGE